MKPQLLCTFTFLDELPTCIGNIHKVYSSDVANMKCYSYLSDMNTIICVYNVYSKERRVKDTISINRKKETNTLYSINALNAIIKVMNNGILDKNYIVNWTDYTNCLVLSEGEENYKTIKIKELSL